MAETTWTEEQTSGPKRKSIPTWVWFCGGGCLLAVLLAVVGIGFGFRFVKRAMDPDVQWQRLALILPYDERPPEMNLVFGNQIGLEQYILQDTRGFQLQIQNHGGKDGTEARQKMFGTDTPEFPQNMLVMKFEPPAPGSVEIQGRELRLFRTRVQFSGTFGKVMPAEAREGLGSMVFVDLTPEGREGMLMLQITRMKGVEPVTDDEIRMLLEHFPVGPAARSAQPAPSAPPQLRAIKPTWRHEGDYAIAEGTVTNVSTESIENVTAVVTFEKRDGGFITADKALIEYDPLMSGQTSPWKVMTRWNPEMSDIRVEFKTLLGSTLRTKQE